MNVSKTHMGVSIFPCECQITLKCHYISLSPWQPPLPQVRLHDGSRLVVRMNNSRTVGDLREYVRMARPALREGRKEGAKWPGL